MSIYPNCSHPHLAASTASCRYKCKCFRCLEYLKQKHKNYKSKINPERKKEIYNSHYKKQRTELNEYKKLLKCEDCGYDKNCALLEFHHINPDIIQKRNTNPRNIIKEHKAGITICVCPTCHAQRHYNPKTQMVDHNYTIK